jgi:hypothetical protein
VLVMSPSTKGVRRILSREGGIACIEDLGDGGRGCGLALKCLILDTCETGRIWM